MILGYTRVSRDRQNLDLQLDSLKKFGCDKVFQEKMSGSRADRPEYNNMISQLRKGDTVVIWKIDRLGRTTLELVRLMTELKEKGIRFVSVTEGIDTGTQMGKVWFMLCAVFAENEREVIIERTRAGLESARSRGRKGGRPKGIPEKNRHKATVAASLYNEGKMPISKIMEAMQIKSKATLYAYLRGQGVKIKGWEISRKEDEAVVLKQDENLAGPKKTAKTSPAKAIKVLSEKKTTDSGRIENTPKKIPVAASKKSQKIEPTLVKPKKKNKFVSIQDAKRMIGVGAECTSEITDKYGQKKLKVFRSLNVAIKEKNETGSNSYIWIWNKEGDNEIYIVADEKKKPI